MKIGIAGPIQTAPLIEFLDGVDLDKAPEGLGGIPVTQLVKGLLNTDHEVSVYSLDQNIKKREVLHGKNLTLYYGPFRIRHKIWDFLKLERESIRDFIIGDRPDIVHAHWTYEFALGALASGIPTLITVHDWAPAILRFKTDHYRFGRLLMACATFFKGSYFIANSPYIQKCLKKRLYKDVPVIPNTLDEAVFYEGERYLSASCPTIVSINNGFAKGKNVKPLMRAYKLIKKEIPACRLMLIGSGFEKDGEADKWAKNNYLSDGVEFAGPLPHTEVFNILESVDLLIHPSFEESFGMTLLEAMAKKIPVIGGKNSGAVPWVLNYGKAGVLTDIKSPEHIADEAINLLIDEELWKMFSTAGYQYAWDNFRLSKIVDQSLNEYEKILTSMK
ncbi:glycosyltransferase family 4 protein [Candidatus Parcubacteria bacterium]|nr:glycosyltransferase family 4 protein [Candidatus Parcubacteria bacterium]